MAQRNLLSKSCSIKLFPQALHEDMKRTPATQCKPVNLMPILIKKPLRKLKVLGPVKIPSKNWEGIQPLQVKPRLTIQSSQLIKDSKEVLGDYTTSNHLLKCRVCLNKGDIPIFVKHEDHSGNLCSLAGIEVDKDDEYPKYICSECHCQLLNAVKFRNTAKHSDMLLRQSKPKQLRIDEIDSECSNDNSLGELKETNFNDEIVTTVSEPKQLEEDRFDNTDEDDIYTDGTLSESKSKDINGSTLTSDTKIEKKKKVDKLIICEKCDLQFYSITSYKKHKRTHKKVCVVCPKCNKSINEGHFPKHDRACPKDIGTYMCEICGKISVKTSFPYHRATHRFEFPFHCDSCPFKSRMKTTLRSHILRKHTDERRFACDKCPKRFHTNSNLKRHSYTHKDTYDYMCDCGRGFHHKKTYEIHKRIDHTGIKEHICNICQKEFSYRKQMIKHELKVHKREKKSYGRMPAYLLAEMQQKNQQQGVSC